MSAWLQLPQRDANPALARERLVAVARLASSVSHAINNVLLGAVGNLELLFAGMKLDAESEELAADSLASLSSGDTLASSLASIGRREAYAPAIVDVREVIRKWARSPAAGRYPAVSIELSLPESPAHVLVDPGYLECALNALLDNAAEALRGSGSARVACRSSADGVCGPRAGGSGPFVTISFTDRGPGISPTAAVRAFELGYMTKAGGRGSGIGLWMVRELAHACAGEARIEPARAGGTTVSLCLPAFSSIAPGPL